MIYLYDIIMLFMLSFLNLLFKTADTTFIAAALIVIVICCTIYYCSNIKCIYIICTIYCLLCIINPVFLIFLPMIFYAGLFTRNTILILLYPIILIISFIAGNLEFQSFVITLLGMAFALYAFNKSTKLTTLLDTYIKSTDDSREKHLLLKEKNKVLMENQNYEIYTATLKERNRIARDIHDNVGHMLSRAILVTGALKTINKQDNLNPTLDNLDSTLNTAMDNIRSSVHDLHDESVNLKESVNELIKGFDFCRVNFNYHVSNNIAANIKYSFITIIKESLSNIVRHSNATHVEITIQEHPYMYQLVIKDNGSGAKIKSTGIGLSNMKERTESLNGTINFSTDKGFKIFVTVPKN